MSVATSLNGWAAPPARIAAGIVPGTKKKITLQVDVLPLFLAVLSDWHRTVHSIDHPGALGPDGYVFRKARMANGYSNHASGTACDIDYGWLTAAHRNPMTPAQIAAVHALLAKYVDAKGRRIFGWGGDWSQAYLDPMHLEVAQKWAVGAAGRPSTLADVRNVIAHLHIQPNGTVKVPAVAPAKPVVAPAKPVSVIRVPAIPPFPGPFGHGAHGPWVVALQLGLGIAQSGVVNDATFAALKKWQLLHPAYWPANGHVSAKMYQALARPI